MRKSLHHCLCSYASLFAGAPPAKEDTTEDGSTPSSDDPGWFLRRVLALLKGDVLRRGMPTLISDTRKSLDAMAADPSGLTDPFESIYRVVYQLTMRTVACHEIAEDPALLSKTLHLYEEVERAATPAVVMYPWLPTPAKFRRMWGGAQLYMIFKKIVADRLRTNTRSEDALQICMDSGDDIKTIITFVLGALFAGQLNSGINAAWVLVYLSQNPHWQAEARAEVEAVCDRYVPDKSLSLKDRLSQLPADAWETDFKILELCLRDSIRIQTAGAAFRRNTSGHAITIKAKGEDASSAITIPEGSCVMYHMADIHLDETVYPDPLRWDPGRYLPDRAEDRKKPLGYIGWGAARHPCPGQRFAKLESNIITAFFLAYFDFEYSDKEGRTGEGVKPTEFNVNAHSAHKPSVPCCLKYRKREEVVAAGA